MYVYLHASSVRVRGARANTTGVHQAVDYLVVTVCTKRTQRNIHKHKSFLFLSCCFLWFLFAVNIYMHCNHSWSCLYLVDAFNCTRKKQMLGLLFIIVKGFKYRYELFGEKVVKATSAYTCLFFPGEGMHV